MTEYLVIQFPIAKAGATYALRTSDLRHALPWLQHSDRSAQWAYQPLVESFSGLVLRQHIALPSDPALHRLTPDNISSLVLQVEALGGTIRSSSRHAFEHAKKSPPEDYAKVPLQQTSGTIHDRE